MAGQVISMALDWLHAPVMGLTRGDVLLLVVVVALGALLVGIKAVRK